MGFRVLTMATFSSKSGRIPRSPKQIRTDQVSELDIGYVLLAIIWVCLKMGYTPNEIAIKSRDNDQQNHWV